MELLQQAFLAFFAATGIAVLLWNILRRLLFTPKEAIEKHVVLIPKEQDAPVLEKTVAELQRVTVCGKRFDSIRIDERALSEETRKQVHTLILEANSTATGGSDYFGEHIT